MKKSAFTLIELLVVITIVAILMAIALPVYTGIQEKARVTQDASNLRQIGIALITYLSDKDDIMPADSETAFGALNPLAGGENTTDSSTGDTSILIMASVFKSPFDSRSITAPFPLSYGFNANALGKDLAGASSVSALMMIATAPDPGNENVVFTGDTAGPAEWTSDEAKSNEPRGTHNSRKRINALFGDGHTENLAWRDFADSTSTEGKRRWDQFQ